MRSSTRELLWRISVPQHLLVASAFAYGIAFALLVAYGRPGLGLGQCFYVPVILAAAATSAPVGVVAGAGALFLYELGLHARDGLAWTDFTSAEALIRLGSYAAAGGVTGFLAVRGRRMLAEALHVLDDLVDLAQVNLDRVAHASEVREASSS